MRFANRAICAAGLGFAVSALAACGGSGSLLSADQAGQLNTQLSQVQADLEQGDCVAARSAVSGFSGTVNGGLNGVNSTLVSNLQQGAQTIAKLTSARCPTVTQTVTTTTPRTTSSTTSKTTTTPTTTTQTTVTQTIATQTETTQTPPITTTTVPGTGGAGLGSGGGGTAAG